MNIINAKLQNCFKLSSKITVYVPATNGVDKATDNTAQVEKTASLLAVRRLYFHRCAGLLAFSRRWFGR